MYIVDFLNLAPIIKEGRVWALGYWRETLSSDHFQKWPPTLILTIFFSLSSYMRYWCFFLVPHFYVFIISFDLVPWPPSLLSFQLWWFSLTENYFLNGKQPLSIIQKAACKLIIHSYYSYILLIIMTHYSRTEESVPQMLINLLMMLLLATTQFFEGRQNDWTTRMDYLRKIQVISQLENSLIFENSWHLLLIIRFG